MNDSNNGPRLPGDHASSDDAAVARLLRLAGHRPAVPAADTEIVRQAARARWLRAVRAQARRRFLYRGAGGLLAAAALVLLVLNTGLLDPGRRVSGEPIATVEMVTGQVRASVGEQRLADLVLDEALLAGTTVETDPQSAGSGVVPARLAFRLAGTSVRLDTGTRVRILSGNRLVLEYGAVYADSGPGAPASGSALEIHTPLGVASDVGTQFEVRFDPLGNELKVRVREGKVILDRDDDGSHEVHAGFELAVLADGKVEQDLIPRFGPEWQWTLAVLPPFEAESPLVTDVLEWAVRESGWRLSYSDPAFEQQAAVPLPGASIAGLTPEEAVDIALMACDLSHRLEDGVLSVAPAGP